MAAVGAPRAAHPTHRITSKLISDQTNICTDRCILVKMEDVPRVVILATLASQEVVNLAALDKLERAIIHRATYRISRLLTKDMSVVMQVIHSPTWPSRRISRRGECLILRVTSKCTARKMARMTQEISSSNSSTVTR